MPFRCGTDCCAKIFETSDACRQHMRDTGHNVPGFRCDTCVKRFRTIHARDQHMDDKSHWIWPYECETCEVRFTSDWQAEQHMQKKDHYCYDYSCETCDLEFRSEEDRDDHQQEDGHYTHLHCSDCDRYFKSAQNLDQHRKSRIHQGFTVECPFCDDDFTTAGLAHHVESSACPESDLDRVLLFRALRKRDPENQFIEHMYSWDSGFTLADMKGAWNGSGYQCTTCADTFGGYTFERAHSWLQHLETSDAHQPKLYHCPNRRCRKKFPSLAAFYHHLESESCGFTRFAIVQRNASGFLAGRHGRVWHESDEDDSS